VSSDAAQSTPSRRYRPSRAALLGSSLFLAGSFVTVLSVLLPHSGHVHVGAYWALAGAQVALSVILLALPRRLATRTVPAIVVVAGVASVSFAVLMNGERDGGPALLNELFYVWPALYVGYFFGRWGVAAAVALIGVVYAGVLTNLGLGIEASVTRWLVVVSVSCGAAALLRALRSQVDRLLGQLRETARTDSLTGVLNRRGFEEVCRDALRDADGDRPCTLLLGDIDHFKALNDRSGHAAGDEALAKVARALADACRPQDSVGRVGGEEFAILLPATPVHVAFVIAERMRRDVRRADVTMSFGVATAPEHGESLDELMRAADAALYDAKARGRDRTAAFEPGGEMPTWFVGAIAPGAVR
jgi:diguanylate cyclase (GGDEF)-like protein